ncbi:unnamed protein product [Orchesella dallaii]|uniref:Uncharacterized protein n=1 Tax=Orchesella dallaii TaxID=48710 RepID=A0ABP1S6H3_9HEXA
MASSTNTAATTAPSEKSVELNSTASAANATLSSSHAKIKQKEDAAQEASERRRIWAMAAASAAEMLKELTKKSAPEFDDVIQHFAPITPGEWAEKRKILEAMKDPAQDIEEITDAQVADELFYDPDVTDDDLGMFLGASDADLKDMYGGSADNMLKQKQRASKPEVSQRYSTVATKDIEKSSEQVRGSQEQRASVSSHGSVNQPKKSSVVVLRAASHDTDAVPTDSTHTRPSELDVEHRADNIEAHKKGSMQTLNSNSADDLFFGYGEDENVDGENEDETAEDSEMEMYQPANVNINVNEALVGLEDLLEEY